MKNLLPYFLIFCATLCHADRLQYFYGVGLANPTSKLLTLPTGTSLLVLNTGTGLGESATFGSYLTLSGGVLNVNSSALPISTAVQTALDGKFANPSGTTAQYVRGDGTLAAFPSIPASQVNSDWNASSGISQILNRPNLATVATSGAYGDLNGLPTLGSAASQSSAAFATAAQGVKADSALQALDIVGKADKTTAFSAGSGLTGGGDLSTNRTISLNSASIASLLLADSSIQPTAFNALNTRVTNAENAIAAAQAGNTSQYMRGNGTFGTFGSDVAAAASSAGFLNQAGARSAISLTTSGVNGAATYNSSTGVLNVPNYSTTPLSLTTTGVSGLATYNSGTGVLNIPNYSAPRSFNKPSRSLNTAFQISTTQDAVVNYTVDISATISLVAGQTGTVILEYADNVGMTTNVVTVQSTVNGNTGTLTVGLNLTQTSTGSLSGVIPAGKYVRIRTVNTSGTPNFTLREAQEVLLQQTASL